MSEYDELPKFAIAGLTDVVRTTNAKGESGTEFEIGVKGNSAEAVEHLVSHLRDGAEMIGAEFEQIDENSRSLGGSKSFAVGNWEHSNWKPSGSAWKSN